MTNCANVKHGVDWRGIDEYVQIAAIITMQHETKNTSVACAVTLNHSTNFGRVCLQCD